MSKDPEALASETIDAWIKVELASQFLDGPLHPRAVASLKSAVAGAIAKATKERTKKSHG